RRVDGALAAVGLDGLRTRAPHHLSGGQKQLVAIAGVLAMEPDCIILDEATAMLDPAARSAVLGAAVQLCAARGVAVVLITHRMDELAACRRVVALDSGRIAFDGPPEQLFADEGLA